MGFSGPSMKASVRPSGAERDVLVVRRLGVAMADRNRVVGLVDLVALEIDEREDLAQIGRRRGSRFGLLRGTQR